MAQTFSDRVNLLRTQQRLRYADLEAKCNRARSTAWFNNLVNKGTWAVSPPPKDTWDDLAALLGTSSDDVRHMIAEEWYGVTPADGLSPRVTSLAKRLDALDEEDAALVEAVVQRLA